MIAVSRGGVSIARARTRPAHSRTSRAVNSSFVIPTMSAQFAQAPALVALRAKLNAKVHSRRAARSARVVTKAAVAAPAGVSTETVNDSINTIRFLAIDAINKSNSGHPGLPMGCAPMGYVIYREAMTHNPKNTKWFNRDRFVLSAGHGCMLHYSLLHLTGYPSVSVRAHARRLERERAIEESWISPGSGTPEDGHAEREEWIKRARRLTLM